MERNQEGEPKPEIKSEVKEFLTVENLNGKESNTGSKKSSITKIVINDVPEDLMANYNSDRRFNFRTIFCPSQQCRSFIFSSFCLLIVLSVILLVLSVFKLIMSTSQLIEYQNSQDVYLLDPMTKSRESKNVDTSIRTSTTTKRPQVRLTTRRGRTTPRTRPRTRTASTMKPTIPMRKPANKGKENESKIEMDQKSVSVIYSKLISSIFFTCVSFLSLISLMLSRRFPNFATKCFGLLSNIYLFTIAVTTLVILLNVTLIILLISEEGNTNSENNNIDLTTLIQLTGSLIYFTCIFTVNQLVLIQQLEQSNTWSKQIFASQDLSIC